MFRSNGSSKVSINSSKESHDRSHDNADAGLLNIGMLIKKQVSVVPEESEEQQTIVENVSTRLLEVEADLDTSRGFPMSFELTSSSKPTSEEKAGRPNSQDRWLLIPNQLSSPYCSDNSPYSHSPAPIKCAERLVTPDVTPGHSHGIEWCNANSNNE